MNSYYVKVKVENNYFSESNKTYMRLVKLFSRHCKSSFMLSSRKSETKVTRVIVVIFTVFYIFFPVRFAFLSERLQYCKTLIGGSVATGQAQSGVKLPKYRMCKVFLSKNKNKHIRKLKKIGQEEKLNCSENSELVNCVFHQCIF